MTTPKASGARAQLDDAANLEPSERRCAHCERPLKGRFAWMELNCRSGDWSDLGDIPEAESQGWFPVGLTCAQRLVAEHVAKVAAQPQPAPAPA